MLIESQLFELKRHIEAAGVIAPSFFHWLSVDRWRPLWSAAGCSRTLPGGGVRRRGRRCWHVIAKCEERGQLCLEIKVFRGHRPLWSPAYDHAAMARKWQRRARVVTAEMPPA